MLINVKAEKRKVGMHHACITCMSSGEVDIPLLGLQGLRLALKLKDQSLIVISILHVQKFCHVIQMSAWSPFFFSQRKKGKKITKRNYAAQNSILKKEKEICFVWCGDGVPSRHSSDPASTTAACKVLKRFGNFF